MNKAVDTLPDKIDKKNNACKTATSKTKFDIEKILSWKMKLKLLPLDYTTPKGNERLKRVIEEQKEVMKRPVKRYNPAMKTTSWWQ